MAIYITCRCGKELRAREEYAGRTVRCPDCGADLDVPDERDSPRRPDPAARRGRHDDEDDRDRRPPPPRSRRFHDDDEDDDRYDVRLRRSTSGKAIASLVVGLVGFCVPFLTGLVSFILGLWSLADIRKGQGRVTGKGMAITGVVLGLFSILLWGGFTAWAVLYPDTPWRVESDKTASRENLKQIGRAMSSYETANGHLPPPALYGTDGKALLSWRVAILPQLGQSSLYGQFNLNEPWDGPNNKKLLAKMPKVYAPPGNRGKAADDHTYYRAFVGPGAAFDDTAAGVERPRNPWDPLQPVDGRKGLHSLDFKDGPNQTFLVIEAGDAVPWTKPDELAYAPGRALPRLGGVFGGDYHALFADGYTVRFYRKGRLNDSDVRARITRSGGEYVYDWDW